MDLPLDTICSIEFHDFFASEIAARYEQVRSEVDSTSILVGKVDDLLKDSVTTNGLDSTYRTALRRAMDMKVSFHEAKARMRELQQKAEALGYRLDPLSGDLIKATNISSSFIPSHHRTKLELIDDLGIGREIANLTNERPSALRPLPDWQETKFSHEQALNKTLGIKSGLFERISNEYITTTGHNLDDVLRNLDPYLPDSIFGTITLPIYDMGVNTGEKLTRAVSAFRPHPGRMPIRLPELFIEEKYRLVLRYSGVATGEVVESVTLAPGEERTIVIERSTVSERETKTSATSSLDIASEARSELISELESESRRSRDASHSSKWSASANGGVNFGIWNAGGETSGGQTWNETTNDFAKRVSKLTQKASSSLTARTRYEVSSTASFKATTSTREATTINLKNINQGCALTLFLHQLTNRYSQELFLVDLSITVLPATETLLCSEMSLPRQFSLSDVIGVLKAMSVESLPIRFKTTKEAELEAYYKEVLNQIASLLKSYDLKTDDENVKADDLLDEILNSVPGIKSIEIAEKNLKRLAPKSVNYLQSSGWVDGPCAGLLMTTYSSPSTALEDYTNKLREAELEKRRADTKEVLARAAQIEAVGDSLRPAPPDLVAIVKNGGDLKSAKISFVGSVRQGKWIVVVDSIARHHFEADPTILEYLINFTTDQDWLSENNNNLGFLIHEPSRLHIPFVV